EAGLRPGRAVFEGRPDADGDAWMPDQGLDAADQHGRAVVAPELVEARCEVGDQQFLARLGPEHGLQDGAVALIGLPRAIKAVDDDVHEPGLGVLAVQQGVEYGIRIQAWKSEPDVSAAIVDQAGDGAVSDRGEFEMRHGNPRSK